MGRESDSRLKTSRVRFSPTDHAKKCLVHFIFPTGPPPPLPPLSSPTAALCPLLLAWQRQHGMGSLPGTYTNDQQWKSNPRPYILDLPLQPQAPENYIPPYVPQKVIFMPLESVMSMTSHCHSWFLYLVSTIQQKHKLLKAFFIRRKNNEYLDKLSLQ